MERINKVLESLNKPLIYMPLMLSILAVGLVIFLTIMGQKLADMPTCIPTHCVGQFRVLVEEPLSEQFTVQLLQGEPDNTLTANLIIECQSQKVVGGEPEEIVMGNLGSLFGSTPIIICLEDGIMITHWGYKPEIVRIIIEWDRGRIDLEVQPVYALGETCCWSATVKLSKDE